MRYLAKDFRKLAATMVKELRRPETQDVLSRKLNYSYNKVRYWEIGRHSIYWGDAIAIANLASVDPTAVCQRLFAAPDALSLLATILKKQSLGDVARKLGISERHLRRYLADESRVPMHVVLAAVQSYGSSLPNFVSLLLHNRLSEEVSKELCAVGSPLALSQEDSLVLQALELKQYQELPIHSVDIIVKNTSLTTDTVKQKLKSLIERQLIEKAEGKYRAKPENCHSEFYTWTDTARDAAYWYKWLHKYFDDLSQFEENPHDRSRVQFVTFNASRESVEKISAAMRRCFIEVKGILQADQGPLDSSVTLNMALIDLEESCTIREGLR